jgi:ubiquinone/menaquinone biosynthesis C-methylase UbiE
LSEGARKMSEMWASLQEALRRRQAPPEERLAEVGLSTGMKVADVGAGYGYFTFPAAEMVGGDGMVYAVEPDPKRAGEISRRVEERGFKNVEVVVAGAEDISRIPSGGVDVAISMASFHHFTDPRKALSELRRIVRQGGLVYIRDMKPGRIFRHGSRSEEFRSEISGQFPGAEFEEGPRYLVARARV